jgi:hypothetical protein
MDSAKRDEYQDMLSRLLAARNRVGDIRDMERRNQGLNSDQHGEIRECYETISQLDRDLKAEGVLGRWGLTPEAIELGLHYP